MALFINFISNYEIKNLYYTVTNIGSCFVRLEFLDDVL